MALYGYGGDWDSMSIDDLEAGCGFLFFSCAVCYQRLQKLRFDCASASEIRDMEKRLKCYEKGVYELNEYIKSRKEKEEHNNA